jgi:hypothetical protein
VSNISDPFIRLAAEIVADAVVKPEEGGGVRFGRLVAILRRGFEDMRFDEVVAESAPTGQDGRHPASSLVEEIAAADAEPEPPAEPPSQCLGPEA